LFIVVLPEKQILCHLKVKSRSILVLNYKSHCFEMLEIIKKF
jgi:hypothetical protein